MRKICFAILLLNPLLVRLRQRGEFRARPTGANLSLEFLNHLSRQRRYKVVPEFIPHFQTNGEAKVINPPAGFVVSLLDDDPSVVKATTRLLSSAGWKVESFTDPLLFLSHAQISHPQVVVLDILMPEMDGLEVQKRLSSFSPASQVIVLTSKDDATVRAKAMRAGARAFFLKPVADDEFLAEVKSAFAKYGLKHSNGIAA